MYWALSTSFWVRKLLTRFCRFSRAASELLLLLGQLLVLGLHVGDLALGRGPARQRLPGQVLLALGQRRLGLVLEVIGGVLELLLLELEPLAGGGDVHQPAADPGDLIKHLLVGQVEHLVGLLGGIKGLVGLGRDDVVGPLEERHVMSLTRSQAQAAGEVGGQETVGVQLGPQLAELRQPRVHLAQQPAGTRESLAR